MEWAKLPPKDLPSHPITLLIELRAYIQDFARQQCNNFLEFIHKGSGWIGHLNQNELDRRLKQGEVRVLFDGLDEVFDPQQRANVIAQIHNFTQTYDKVKVIVTSRVIGYKPQQLKDAEFHHFMLQDLEPEQIEDFLKKWHDLTYDATTESQKKQDRQQRITKAIKESQAIQQLAVNPLLLTMMAILNRNQDLPRDRAKLYERSSELLLYQWDVERLLEDPELKGVDIDYQDKQAMLRDVAYFMQATEKGLAGNLISQRDLEKILIDYLKTIDVNPARKVARLMIDQLRTRNFILCDIGSNYYAFVHRTFLEYFCAWSYIWQLEAQTLSIEQIKNEVFGEHWQEESWHEVLRLIAGMILDPKNVGEIIEYLMEQDGESANFANLFLAADCLAEVRNRKSITLVANRLLEKLKRFEKFKGKVTFRIGNDLTPNTLFSFMFFLKAIKIIAINWKDDSDTLLWLRKLAQSDDYEKVRSTAIQELARVWHDKPQIFEFLTKCAVADPFSRSKGFVGSFQKNPRETALEGIIEYFPNHPQTKDLLIDRSQNDPDENVRKFAQGALEKLSEEDV